jgi:hypothetical protein
MFTRTIAAAIAASILGWAGGALAADETAPVLKRKPTVVKKVKKVKKPVVRAPKPKTAETVKKKIHRVEDAPDFRAARERGVLLM